MPYKCRWKRKFSNLKSSAKMRGLEVNLTLEDYKKLASDAGITDPSEISRLTGGYCLARYGDRGNYELGNCRFIYRHLNDLETILNGGYQNVSLERKGKTKNMSESRRRCAEKLAFKYRVISPEGDVYEGENLKDFCKKTGLDQGQMSGVCRDLVKSYKGWTGKYIEKEVI